MSESILLSELTSLINNALKSNLPDSVWLVAEINSLNENRSGHCYIELVEKDKNSDNIIAKVRATIWSRTWRMIKPYFKSVTGQDLCEGIKVLVNCNVQFSDIYGLSINIFDIEPSFTLGEIEKLKQEILTRLENEGVLEMNRMLPLPQVPQKIAVISSATAAGFEDWKEQLENNSYGYKFYYKLFPAFMQGAKTENTIVAALDKIYAYEDFFDLVVILRGGGSKSELNSFNNYNIAINVAQYPLPVITGIGHERDETVVDIVANTTLKTPTAVAEFLTDRIYDFETGLNELNTSISQHVKYEIESKKEEIQRISYMLPAGVNSIISENKAHLKDVIKDIKSEVRTTIKENEYYLSDYKTNLQHKSVSHIRERISAISNFKTQLNNTTSAFFKNQKFKIDIREQKIKGSEPENILKKGFSITTKNNKVVHNAAELSSGDIIITKLHKGKVKGRVL